ncbi:hypothetical protein AX16_003168 [Volvariella volvacea WC 439]|nr:hypothetical protein AX16_003168 [Volvariella volvacea WC 439]
MNVLLVPTLRSAPCPASPPPSSPRSRAPSSRLSRPRSASVSQSQSSPASSLISDEWLGIPLKFVVERESFEVSGFQMYAVEKWIVERKPITVLTVYSGNPQHKITVTSLVPSKELSHSEAQEEWEKAIRHLQRQGTRAKETTFTYPNLDGDEGKIGPIKQTKGVVMVTFLPHFRSDYTIVPIPEGNFLAVREQLYTNINLLRMGCSGRTALTLEEPSDATKDRFISTYHLPDTTEVPSLNLPTSTENLPLPSSISSTPAPSPRHKQKHSLSKFTDYDNQFLDVPRSGSLSRAAVASPVLPGTSISTLSSSSRLLGRTKDRAAFSATVLELVKLLQAGLSIFGLYDTVSTGSVLLDGLLCDATVEGIQRWVADIGQAYLSLEPMERIADPTFVSSMLSTVLAMRNRLSALGYNHLIPRDPFLHPYNFALALSAFAQTRNSTHAGIAISNAQTVTSGVPTPSPLYHSTLVASALAMTATPSVASVSPLLSSYSGSPAHSYQVGMTLTRDLLFSIISTSDAKLRPGEGRKVRRALRDKLETAVAGGSLGGGAIGVDSEEENRSGHSPSLPFSPFSGGAVAATSGDDTNTGGGPLLSGIGSFASGFGLGNTAVGGPLAGVMDGITDLPTFLRIATSKEGLTARAGRSLGAVKDKVKPREKKESGEAYSSVGTHLGSVRERDREGQFVGITIRALWSGRVWNVARMREIGADKDKELLSSSISSDYRGIMDREKRWGRGVVSDGDAEGDNERNRYEKSDGRTTEEESDLANSAGGLRAVQKKIWTGLNLNKRRGGPTSLDISSQLRTARSSTTRLDDVPPTPTLIHSPTISNAPSRDRNTRYPEDEDIISSGQNSPIGHRPQISSLLPDYSLDDTAVAPAEKYDPEYQRKLSVFQQVQQKHRPWLSRPNHPRISSWSDTVSAQRLEEAEQVQPCTSDGKQIFAGQRRDWAFPGSGFSEKESNELPYPTPRSRRLFFGPKRRHSFHDLEPFRGIHVLNCDQMRIDVDLCGQLLVMKRREEHLCNVIASVAILAEALSKTNNTLRDNYLAHQDFLNSLEERTSVIAQIQSENLRTSDVSQATNTLNYEAEQFRVTDLWHTASPSRRKVMEYRDKVFGTGGRRLPPGAHGAHNQFNRLQWRSDGKECLVDKLGRTESEAEEESLADPEDRYDEASSEDEADVVEHPNIKPMWLLRFFTRWGAIWGADSTAKVDPAGQAQKLQNGDRVVEPEATEGSSGKPHAR